MQLVESYLYEVGQFLPEDQRDSVLAELRDNLTGEVLGVAEGANRAPNVDDEKSVLARFGHPLKVASSYQPRQYLIGPDLYPTFVQTLRLVLTLVVVAQILISLLASQLSGWQLGPVELLRASIEMIVWAGAIVVLVFVALEASGERFSWYENWHPKVLSAGTLGVIKRGDVVTNLLTEGFFLLWWNDVIVLGQWNSILDGAVQLSLSAAWVPYFWYLNLVFGLLFGLHIYVLVRGVWQRATLLGEITLYVAMLGIGVSLALGGSLLTVSGQVTSDVIATIDRSATTALVVLAGFVVWDIWLGFRTLRGNPAVFIEQH